MIAAGASLGLLIAAGAPSVWTAAVQSAVRGGSEPSSGQTVGDTSVAGEVEANGRFGLFLQEQPVSMVAAYSPRFILRRAVTGELIGSGDSTHQAGEIAFGTRLAPATRLTAYGRGDWGLTDFSPLARIAFPEAPPPAGQPVPPPLPSTTGRVPGSRFVHTLDLDGGLDLAHRFSRDLQLELGAGFHRNGGAGHDAVQVLPLQWGPHGMAGLEWALDPQNALSLRASASQSRFAVDRSSLLSDAQAGWSLRASREWKLDVAAGAGLVRAQTANVEATSTYLAGSVRVRLDPPRNRARRVAASLGMSLAPGVDPLGGQAMQSVRADGELELSQRGWLLAATGSAGRIVNGPGTGAEDFAVGTRASWEFVPGWAVEGGGGVGHTNQVPIAGWRTQVSLGLRWNIAGRL